MILTENILAFLFATTATIVAALTGLTEHSQQNIQNEVDDLLQAVRYRKKPLGTLNE